MLLHYADTDTAQSFADPLSNLVLTSPHLQRVWIWIPMQIHTPYSHLA